MYQEELDWDDTRLFLAVVREGSLRAAGRKLGLSQPTVGRRLARFEAAMSPVPLFDRLPEGLRLTAAGTAVLPLAERLEIAATALRRRHAIAARSASIRISVGESAGGFLARCLGKAGRLPDDTVIELVESDHTANLTRREADLAVRHGRPETGDLYVARVGAIAYAVYAASEISAAPDRWITYAEEQAHYSVSRWIAATLQATGGSVAARASSMSMLAAAARAGAGRAVLPCYLGDRDPALVRVHDRIEPLDAQHWLIVHRDLRRLPLVRSVIEWIGQVFTSHRDLLEGNAGLEENAGPRPEN